MFERESSEDEFEEGTAARLATLIQESEAPETEGDEAGTLGPMAFTSGNANVFGGGGLATLPHESSHVVQQARGALFSGMY